MSSRRSIHDPAKAPQLPPDEQLFQQVRLGDLSAFEQVFRRHYAGMCRFAMSMGLAQADAEDVVADVFARIWEYRDRMAFTGAVRAYLFTAVRNRCSNHRSGATVRRQAGERMIVADHQPWMGQPQPDPDAVLDFRELERELEAALSGLPIRARQVFELHRQHGLSKGEVAVVLGISPRTVEGHLARALRELAEALFVTDGSRTT